jgi:hypothetical protein
MKNFAIIAILLAVLLGIFIISAVLHHKNDIRNNFVVGENTGGKNHTCGKSCNQLDDVLDPILNVKLMVENALLLEDHMANDKRYCQSCALKHYLLIIAYAEEAVWLAGSKCSLYPNLTETVIFYNESMNYWLDNKDNKEVRLEIIDKLRQKRKELMEDYILNGKEMQEKIKQANKN